MASALKNAKPLEKSKAGAAHFVVRAFDVTVEKASDQRLTMTIKLKNGDSLSVAYSVEAGTLDVIANWEE